MLQYQPRSGDLWRKLLDPPLEYTWQKMSIGKGDINILFVGETTCHLREKHPPHRSSYWFDNYSIWRWERWIRPPHTSTPSTECCSELSSQGINFEEEVTAFRAYQRFGRYSAQHSPTATWSGTWTKQSSKYSPRTFDENQWESPSMNGQKPTTPPSQWIGSTVPENKSRELGETRLDRDIEKIDYGRNRGTIDQVFFSHTAERLVTRFPIVDLWRGRRMVDASSTIRDDPTRTALPKATKSILLTPDQERSSH